jgi:hypothetical protein
MKSHTWRINLSERKEPKAVLKNSYDVIINQAAILKSHLI